MEGFVDGGFVGRAYGWYVPADRWVVEKIEIEPAFRSQGHGGAMIERLRAQARDAGCRDLVFKGVRRANTGAIRLYSALGAVAGPAGDALVDYVLSPP